jgi:hypothetical protein
MTDHKENTALMSLAHAMRSSPERAGETGRVPPMRTRVDAMGVGALASRVDHPTPRTGAKREAV